MVYQIYPRSFHDSNGDGVGDIQGIIQKLDYIKNLGVDIIWLCPVYKSPNDDNGYDISDYQSILEEYGTMSDFDRLLEEIHSRGLKLLMDLVVNHSSDEHNWFEESRSSKDSEKREYYIWEDGKDGGPPNNWKSFFGGDAWEFDPNTGQYYLHLFTRKQPDFNWENPEVRREIFNMMKFWLDKGIDGFRMDVISLISKRTFDDTPYAVLTDTIDKIYANGPKVHEYLQEMNREVLSKYDICTVGEGPGITLDKGIQYVDENRKELNMVFHFDHMFMDHGKGGRFDNIPVDFQRFKSIFGEWDQAMNPSGWSSIFLGNHDFTRMLSRFGNDKEYRSQSAKLLGMLVLTMRGTPFIYQGDEIGMTNMEFSHRHEFRDVEILNYFREIEEAGGDIDKAIELASYYGRDNARTPMQWDNSASAGFTEGSPWIKLNPNSKEINVSNQEQEPDSVLLFYKRVITFRKHNKTMVYGEYQQLDDSHPNIFAYSRFDEDGKFLILLNFSNEEVEFAGIAAPTMDQLVISNYDLVSLSTESIIMRPWQATLFKIR